VFTAHQNEKSQKSEPPDLRSVTRNRQKTIQTAF